jgi:hypothetical protein
VCGYGGDFSAGRGGGGWWLSGGGRRLWVDQTGDSGTAPVPGTASRDRRQRHAAGGAVFGDVPCPPCAPAEIIQSGRKGQGMPRG